jgi:hypothetical protein
MIINNRKGVSAVVANVLIILLVVVGVALIWAAVRPAIETGAQGIQSDCITTSLEVSSCTATSVIVKRNAGGIQGPVTDIRLIRNDGSTDSVETPPSVSINALESKPFTVTAVTSSDSYNVAAVINGEVCQVLSSPKPCS